MCEGFGQSLPKMQFLDALYEIKLFLVKTVCCKACWHAFEGQSLPNRQLLDVMEGTKQGCYCPHKRVRTSSQIMLWGVCEDFLWGLWGVCEDFLWGHILFRFWATHLN